MATKQTGHFNMQMRLATKQVSRFNIQTMHKYTNEA